MVTGKPVTKKYEAYFLKEAKAAALQLPRPKMGTAGDEKATNLKEIPNTSKVLRIVYPILFIYYKIKTLTEKAIKKIQPIQNIKNSITQSKFPIDAMYKSAPPRKIHIAAF